METKRKPLDMDLNAAIVTIAGITLPRGWHEVERFEDAPTDLSALVRYADKHGVLCVAREDSDGTIYDDPDVNVALRAWHDGIHYLHRFQFNAAGEAAATYVHISHLARKYGDNPRTVRWASFLMADLLGLVHYHQQTGLWPKDKAKFVTDRCNAWYNEAEQVVKLCAAAGPRHEIVAVARSAEKWGNPYA